MRRVFAAGIALLLAVGASSLFVRASVLSVPSGTWAPTGDLRDTRAGAAAVLLSDGIVLISGGSGADGLVASAERYSVSGGTFIATASMATARANHTATALNDGRVLVVGGFGADGAAMTSAELYDPATNAWTPAGALADARAGHSATLLADGRVLVAGGEGSEGALATLEVYSPVFEDFALVATPMTAARMRHGAALAGEKVLITGGWDGAAVLASVDVFDPETNSVAAGPSMLSARAEHTATTLLSGNVLVAGGVGEAGELQSAEVFDAVAGAFVPTAGAMASARRNHLAILLPHNNSVLIAGGSSGGAPSATAELYRAWQDDGIFASTGSSVAPRNWSAGSALSFAASATNRSGPADGLVLVAGGEGASSAELYGFATVKTDKDDYQPGDVVYVSGSGWVPNQPVTFLVYELPAEHYARLVTIDADEAGNINGVKLFDVEEHHLDVRFLLTAADGVSQAHMTFTDGNVNVKTVGSPTAANVTWSRHNTTSCTGPADGSGTISAGLTGNGTGIPGGTSAGTSLRLTAGTVSGYSFVNWTGGVPDAPNSANPICVSDQNGTRNIAVNYAAITTVSTTISASNAAATYGASSVTLNAAVTPASGPAVGVGTVTFTVKSGVTTIGTATSGTVTGGSASATFSLSGVNAGSYTIEAAYSGGTGFNASNNAAQIPAPTLTVNKAATTTTVTCSAGPFTYTGAAHEPCSANVTGAGELNQVLTVNYTNNTNAGSATASATFAETTNHLGSNDSKNFTIGKANATIVVNGFTGGYDGAAHSATGTATGVLGEALAGLDLGASFTNVPGGTANWTFTDATGNYNNASGTAAIVITKVDATIVVNGYTGAYDGNAHGATGTATGIGDVPLAGLDLGASFTNVPGGTANWTFTDVTGNYNDTSGSAAIVITKVDATIDVAGYTGVYDGDAHGATGTATGVQSEPLAGLDPGASFTNVPGGTANWVFTDVTGNYNNASGTAAIVITKVDATIVVNGYSGAYDGTAHAATGTATGVGGADLSAGLNFGASFTDVPGGTANWTFTDVTGNYNDASGSVAIVISKANATVTVNGYTGVYDGNAHGATGTATGVGGADLNAGLNFGASFTDVPGGTANWTFTGGTNYYNTSGMAAIVIAKANATINVVGYTGVFDGNPHGASGTAVGAGGANLSSSLSLGSSFTNVPGGTANWSFAGGTNYNNASGSVSINITTACSVFNGFLSPIGGAVEKGTGGSFADPVKTFKLNSTIPVKFSATCYGAPLTTGIQTLRAIKYSNASTGESPIDASPTDAATQGNQFRLSGLEWHFNLSTKGGMSQGIWLLEATLFDGSTYTVWIEIKK